MSSRAGGCYHFSYDASIQVPTAAISTGYICESRSMFVRDSAIVAYCCVTVLHSGVSCSSWSDLASSRDRLFDHPESAYHTPVATWHRSRGAHPVRLRRRNDHDVSSQIVSSNSGCLFLRCRVCILVLSRLRRSACFAPRLPFLVAVSKVLARSMTGS